jgi:nitroreductase
MISKDTILNACYFRHACKVFDADRVIPAELFETILESGRLSPSSFGFEPWQFAVVQNRALREELKSVTWGAQGTLPTASHFVVIFARRKNTLHYQSDYITHMMYDIHHIPKEAAEQRREKYRVFQEEDFALLDNERALFDWAGKQCYIALGNMMNTAAMLGIDSCAIEGFKAKELEEIMRKSLGIDTEQFGVAVMVAFGYRRDMPKKKTRQKMEDIVKWYC